MLYWVAETPSLYIQTHSTTNNFSTNKSSVLFLVKKETIKFISIGISRALVILDLNSVVGKGGGSCPEI
jgi:hypothetical protein